jgi:DNA polymerase III epsilon subunit-like protein
MKLPEFLGPLTRPFLVLDEETTHTNKDVARIVELGIEIHMPGKPTREYRTYINPTIPIPPSSTKIHGITDGMVAGAPTFESLADNLLKGFIGADFGGYNIRFDMRILSREFKRARKIFDYEDARIIDFFRTWQNLEPRSLDDAVHYWIGYRLAAVNPELAAQYQQEIAEAGKSHGALRDVIASSRVGSAQFIVSGDKMPHDIQVLHDQCWPGWFDAEGKLQWRDGQLCVMFGVHREKTLRQVPRDYLHWIAHKGDFEPKVKDVCRKALRGNFPEPLAAIEDPDDELS